MTMSVAAVPDWDSLFKLDQYCINVVFQICLAYKISLDI